MALVASPRGAPRAPLRGGDPTLASSSATTEEEFMQVLDEMHRICGDDDDERGGLRGEEDAPLSNSSHDGPPSGSPNFESSLLSTSPLEPLFGAESVPGDHDPAPSASGEFRSTSFLDGLMSGLDQDSPSPPALHLRPKSLSTASSKSRSRHCSANSSLSCVSFDSAIGDVYSVQTPPRTSFEFDQDLLEATPSMAKTAVSYRVTSTIGSSSSSAVCSTASRTSSASLYHENVLSSSLSPADSVPSPAPPPANTLYRHPKHQGLQQRRQVRQQNVATPYVHPRAPIPPPSASSLFQRQEVEMVCLDLLRRFQHAASLHPKQMARAWISRSGSDDPLLITTRLISDALTRLRIFLFGLEPMNWLTWPDRHTLYNSQVCCVSILKACVSVDLATLPAAYPLPYGEFLGEVEALHLILAHDLYNELKTLVSQVQQLEGIRELPVMLLIMMVAFFKPQPNLVQVEKVVRIHDYYTHKLQVYLHVRHGPVASHSLMCCVQAAIEKVRNFSARLREFMNDVTRCGLQKQYESVCENIGLMAFLLQSEPPSDQ